MKVVWDRIEAWLKHNAEPVLKSLCAGAKDEDVASVESRLGVPLPGDYRESMALHDGQQVDEFGGSLGFLFGLNLYSLHSILLTRKTMEESMGDVPEESLEIEAYGPVRPVWLDPRWVMIADDGAGNYYCLDLNPAEGGYVGQIISVPGHEHSRRVIADSFHEWLARFADALEAGAYIYSESHCGLISRRDAIAAGIVEA